MAPLPLASPLRQYCVDKDGRPVRDQGPRGNAAKVAEKAISAREHEASPSVGRPSEESHLGYVKGYRCLGSPSAFGGN